MFSVNWFAIGEIGGRGERESEGVRGGGLAILAIPRPHSPKVEMGVFIPCP